MKGSDSIRCPAPGCDTVWSFKSVADAACLSPYEAKEFEQRMISNRLDKQSAEIKRWPRCKSSFRRLNENKRIHCRKCTEKTINFYFCWSCLREWGNESSTQLCGNLECGDYTKLFECLATCKRKALNGIQCPSRRACPKCMILIEHTVKCKHMTCPNKNCNYDFCFICLQSFPCGTAAYEPCKLAPRQQSTSLPSSHRPSRSHQLPTAHPLHPPPKTPSPRHSHSPPRPLPPLVIVTIIIIVLIMVFPPLSQRHGHYV